MVARIQKAQRVFVYLALIDELFAAAQPQFQEWIVGSVFVCRVFKSEAKMYTNNSPFCPYWFDSLHLRGFQSP